MTFEQALSALRQGEGPENLARRGVWQDAACLLWDGSRVEFSGIESLSEDDINGDDWSLEGEADAKSASSDSSLVAELVEQGWRWGGDDGNMLSHPDLPEMNVWRHPYTGQVLLSPRLVAWLKENADRGEQATQ